MRESNTEIPSGNNMVSVLHEAQRTYYNVACQSPYNDKSVRPYWLQHLFSFSFFLPHLSTCLFGPSLIDKSHQKNPSIEYQLRVYMEISLLSVCSFCLCCLNDHALCTSVVAGSLAQKCPWVELKLKRSTEPTSFYLFTYLRFSMYTSCNYLPAWNW